VSHQNLRLHDNIEDAVTSIDRTATTTATTIETNFHDDDIEIHAKTTRIETLTRSNYFLPLFYTSQSYQIVSYMHIVLFNVRCRSGLCWDELMHTCALY
jgi:hypothetical protein